MAFKHRRALLGALIAVFVLGIAGVASATVTFDPGAGTGFVGKGDVQVPFGWNDAKLQQNATGVSFAYSSSTQEQYAVTCGWDTTSQQGREHIIVVTHHTRDQRANLHDSVAYDVTKKDRQNPNGKVTGFILQGKENVQAIESGAVPVIGAACPESQGEGVDATIESFELLSSSTAQALTASYGTTLSAVVWTA